MPEPEEQSHNRDAPTTPVVLATGGLILALAAVVRVIGLGAADLWLDECCSILTILNPAGILADLRLDNNPPLYFFLLKGWSAIFGIGETAARSLSVVFALVQMVALGMWLREIGYRWNVALWGMFVAAALPLHWYYSREARPYMLLLLLCTLALWTAARIIRRGGNREVAVHALIVAAGLHTHELFIPFITALYVQAALLGATRKAWLRLVVAHAIAAAIYLPWLTRVIDQPKSEALSWVADVWRQTPPSLAILRSLEAFSVGGLLPPYLRMGANPSIVRFVAVGLFALCCAVAIAVQSPKHGHRRTALVLVGSLLTPLVLLFAYSLVRQPIYVVGRYDLIALPGALGLMAVGLGNIDALIRSRRISQMATFAAVVVIGGLGAYTIWHQPAPTHATVQSRRMEALGTVSDAEDIYVAVGLEGAKVAYQMAKSGLPNTLVTFPLETRRHFGWLHPRYFGPGAEQLLRQDAASIVHLAMETPTARVWVLADPARPPAGDVFTAIVTSALTAAGYTSTHELPAYRMVAYSRK